jgi:hypothetical protein
MAGLAITALGIVLFNISPFLNWVDPEEGSDPRTGYETDSLVPFIAYLGIGLLVALVYAGRLARRGQQCLAFGVNPMGGLERGDDLGVDIGVWVGFISALIWAIGAGMLEKEIEGDDERADVHGRQSNP